MISALAEFLYTTVLRPAPFRWLVNRLILAIIPASVTRNGCRIYLNPADPVISGALFFNVYENSETRFVLSCLQPGDVFIDIGANVGYYTAMAMSRVGEQGLVIAIEPDPESFAYLEKTVAASGAGNARLVNEAVSDRQGSGNLYINVDNRGDNRLHAFPGAVNKLEVKTTTLDQILADQSCDLAGRSCMVKIDIQGSEGLALAGAGNTISEAGDLTLLFEFWPAGLQAMGTDAAALLRKLESRGMQLYTLGGSTGMNPVHDPDMLVRQHPGRKYVNIVARKPVNQDRGIDG